MSRPRWLIPLLGLYDDGFVHLTRHLFSVSRTIHAEPDYLIFMDIDGEECKWSLILCPKPEWGYTAAKRRNYNFNASEQKFNLRDSPPTRVQTWRQMSQTTCQAMPPIIASHFGRFLQNLHTECGSVWSNSLVMLYSVFRIRFGSTPHPGNNLALTPQTLG